MISSKQESLQWGWLQHSWGLISCLGLFCQPFPHRQKVGWHTMGLHIPFGFHAHIWSHLALGLGKLFPGKSPLVCMAFRGAPVSTAPRYRAQCRQQDKQMHAAPSKRVLAGQVPPEGPRTPTTQLFPLWFYAYGCACCRQGTTCVLLAG